MRHLVADHDLPAHLLHELAREPQAEALVRPTGRDLPVRPCVDRRIALELAGTACVVECAQVEVGRDALLGDVLRGDGEEYGAQVGDGLVRVRVRFRDRVGVGVGVRLGVSTLTKKPASLRMMRLRMAGLPRMVQLKSGSTKEATSKG